MSVPFDFYSQEPVDLPHIGDLEFGVDIQLAAGEEGWGVGGQGEIVHGYHHNNDAAIHSPVEHTMLNLAVRVPKLGECLTDV